MLDKDKLNKIRKIYNDYIGLFITQSTALSLIGDIVNDRKIKEIGDISIIDLNTNEIIFQSKKEGGGINNWMMK